MTKVWEDIAKTLKEGVDTVVEKTEELTKIGKIKVEIMNLNRQIERLFTELGGKVHHLIVDEQSRQVAGNQDVKDLIGRIQALDAQLREKETEVENVKSKDGKGKEATTVD